MPISPVKQDSANSSTSKEQPFPASDICEKQAAGIKLDRKG